MQWNHALPQDQFAYNSAIHNEMGMLSFAFVYRAVPMHGAKYKAATDKHHCFMVFEKGDSVMVFLRKECFPVGTYSKLKPSKYGPYKIHWKINGNTYVIEILKTFNVTDLHEFHNDVPLYTQSSSSMSTFKEDETDEEQIGQDNF